MREKYNVRKAMPQGFVAVHVVKIGDRQSRWMVYDAEDHYRGDLVYWHKTLANPAVWSFTNFLEDKFTEGTFEEVTNALKTQLAS